MKKIIHCLMLLIALALLLACAGNDTPTPASPAAPGQPADGKSAASGKNVAIDGVVQDGEYALVQDFPPFRVWVSRSKDTIRFAVSTKTTGWVALGIGSGRMNGAAMFMGAVMDGKAVFSEQTGRGHGHGETAADQRLAAKYAVREDGGATTLELECPAAKVAPADAKALPIILAYSPSDSFANIHAARRSDVLNLE